MSMTLMVDAMKVKVGNPLRKLVLIKLADNANDQGECWPSFQHIADQCEIDRRSVIRHVAALEGAGFLSREYRKGTPKGNASNVYTLTIQMGKPFEKSVRPAKSAGDTESLGECQKVTRVVTQIHQGSDTETLGGSDTESPRTSHSFEPVIEPVTEPFATQALPESRQVALIDDGAGLGSSQDEVKPRCNIPSDMPGPKDQTCKTFKAWANYAMAYRKRYGAWPVWNQKVAGQMGQLVKRLGADTAHHVSAFFVTIEDARLISGFHSVGDLLMRCEAYCTQWQTNRRMNGTTARQAERRQANMEAGLAAAKSFLGSEGLENNEFM